MSIDGDDVFYPGSTTVRRSAGGDGPEIPDTEPQSWERFGKRFKMEGKTVILFPISALAEALGRDVKTVRHWIQDKRLPEADNRTVSSDQRGRWRLWTAAQINGLQRIAREEGLMSGARVYVTRTNFTAKANALFAELDAE